MIKLYYGVKVKFYHPTEDMDTRISASACRWYEGKAPRIWRSRNYARNPVDDAAMLASEYMERMVLPERARLWGEQTVSEYAELAGIVECGEDVLVVLFNIKMGGGAA